MSQVKPFLKEFEIRWSDVDANRHLGNFAYINFMSHTRMAFLEQIGFNHKMMGKLQVGPVVIREGVHYFREVLPGQKVLVGAALKACSEDFSVFSFEHRFYTTNGKNVALGEMTGTWISLIERKRIPLPQPLLEIFEKIPKAENFKIIDLSAIRLPDAFPIHMDHKL